MGWMNEWKATSWNKRDSGSYRFSWSGLGTICALQR